MMSLRANSSLIIHHSSFEGLEMKEETLTKIPELRDRLTSVRSYL